MLTQTLTRWTQAPMGPGGELAYVPRVMLDHPRLSWRDVTGWEAEMIARRDPPLLVIEVTDDDQLNLSHLEQDGQSIVLFADRLGWDPDEIPDAAWFGRLRSVLAHQGLPPGDISEAIGPNLERRTRREIACQLINYLGGSSLPPQRTQRPPSRKTVQKRQTPGQPPIQPPPTTRLQEVQLTIALMDPVGWTKRPLDEVRQIFKICRRCPDRRFNGRHCICTRIRASEAEWLLHLADADRGCPRYHW